MTTKTTKRALLMSALALFLCFSMLIGTTFAWFTDEVKSANNVITAGNLDIELEYAKVVNGAMTAWAPVEGEDKIFDPNALWEPGRVEIVYLKTSNIGTLALKYQLGVNVYAENPGTNMAGEEFKLSEHLVFSVVEVQPDANGNVVPFTDRAAVQAAAGTQKGLKDYTSATTKLDVEDVDYVALIVYMPDSVGNEANYRGDSVPSITLGINLYATQVEAETDSFGPDYDELADILDAILAHGGNVIFNQNFDAEGDNLVVEPGAEVEVDLDDYTLTGNLTNKGTIIIENGTMNEVGRGFNNTGSATLNNIVMNTGSAQIYANHTQGAAAETIYNDVEINSAGGGISVAEGGKVTFEDGSVSINSTSTSQRHIFFATGANTEVTVNGGTFSIDAYRQRSYACALNGAVIYITGGTFGAAPNHPRWKTPIYEEGGEVIITGGTFGFDPSEWVDTGYKAEKVGANWIVVPENVAAVVSDAASMQNALDAAADGDVIYVNGDINGDVVAAQKPGVNVTIDGNGHTFAGVLLVDGKSGTYTTAGLTIKDFVFKADSISADACIQLGKDNNTRYTCNVTVDGCTFDVPGAVGVKSYTGGDKNLTITDCTATANAHSLVQAKGIDGVLVENCKVYSKNGLNFNNSTNVTVDTCTVDVKGYAVRFGESSGGTGAAEVYTIKNCTLTSANDDGDATIILRGTADNSTLTIENTTIVGTPDIQNTAANATVVEQ